MGRSVVIASGDDGKNVCDWKRWCMVMGRSYVISAGGDGRECGDSQRW